jgi:hypothetical protein
MTQSTFATQQPSTFRPLQQSAFSDLEHAAFFKGLLKPFKGKGDLDDLARLGETLRDELAHLSANQVLVQAERYPFSLLPIRLVRQSTGAGTVFLRWCNPDRSRMGTELWGQLICDDRTPDRLLPDLYELELQRIALNMQISLMHTLSRQASQCARKMAYANTLYRLRTNSTNRDNDKEA